MAESKLPSKVYAVRIAGRGAPLLDQAILESGLSQARYFRLALESLISAGGVQAASFEHGRARGRADVGLLMEKFADDIRSMAAKLAEPDEPDVDGGDSNGG